MSSIKESKINFDDGWWDDVEDPVGLKKEPDVGKDQDKNAKDKKPVEVEGEKSTLRDIKDPFYDVPDVVVYDHFVKFLTNLKDFVNLMQVSPSFTQRMVSTKATPGLYRMFQLPQFQLHLHCMDAHELLSLTKLNPDWKLVVENYFDRAYVFKQEIDYRSFSFLRDKYPPPVPGVSWFGSDGKESLMWVSRFQSADIPYSPTLHEVFSRGSDLKRASSRDGNPFLRRSAHFRPTYETLVVRKEWWERVERMLASKGPELRRAAVVLTDCDVMDLVLKALNQLPNLHELNVTGCEEPHAAPGVGVSRPVTSVQEMKSLVTLTLTGIGPMLFNKLSALFDRIRTLDISIPRKKCGACFLDLYNPRRHSSFPQLQRLHLSLGCGKPGPGKLQNLLKLRSFQSQLKELVLESCSCSQLSLALCFYAMEPFKDSLLAFSLAKNDHRRKEPLRTLEDVGVKAEELQLQKFNFPKLRILYVDMGRYWMRMEEELLALKDNLRYLRISYCKSGIGPGPPGEVEVEERIQLRSCWDNLDRSNVWEMIPELREVQLVDVGVGARVYYRENHGNST